MPAPLSFEFKQLWRLLEDRQWHDYDDIKSALAGKIAPGRALRRYEERTANRIERDAVARAREPEMSDAKKVIYGARMLAGVAINSMRGRYLDIEDTPSGKRIRLRPGVPAPQGLRDDGDADETESNRVPRPVREETSWPEDLNVTSTANELSETQAVTTPDEVHETQDGPNEPAPEAAEAAEDPGVPETTPEPVEEVLNDFVVDEPDEEDDEPPVPPEGTEARQVFDQIMEGLGLPRVPPVVPEARLRQIIREEVERVLEPALEAFQDGMQIWLMQRLAGLELIIAHSQATDWSAVGRKRQRR